MEEDIAKCHVRVLNDKTSKCVYIGRKELNVAELEAIKMSNTMFIDQKDRDIKNISFNYDDLTLEVTVEY